jgi:tetratricopeptide (TPR) repeat protein/predicted aspartyl protease
MPLVLALCLASAHGAERCTLKRYTLPVTMEGAKALVSARINGAEARFVVDTGAFYRSMSPAAAAQYKLDLRPAPFGMYVTGIGGSVIPRVATIKTFTLAGADLHDVDFLVAGNDGLAGAAGFLGENLFRAIGDLEIDLANGVLRLVRPEHCGRSELAYWATTQPIGVVDLHWTTQMQPHLIGEARLNGHTIRVLFDTGAGRSILSWRAAKRAGISPSSPGVVRLGVITGIGREPVALWSAPVDTFEIGGDEKIEHTRVAVADLDLPPRFDVEMLLGADFFLAHHVYVANSQGKLYFTYNGGPVFNLSVPQASQTAAAPQTAATSAGGTTAAANAGTPMDAADLLRRGAAYASRQEFALALADLTRACDLAPKDANCRYQRGLVYWKSGKPVPALADFDSAISLDPNDFQARLMRAQLQFQQHRSGVQDDLDAVDRLAPPQASVRLTLGYLYNAIEQYAAAIHQFDLWLDAHADDVNLPIALASRCGAEAAAKVDFDRALADCDRAIHIMPKTAPVHEAAVAVSNRGLVHLRENRLDDALADFDAALKLQPEFPLARYERGLVELRKGLESEGQADIAAAQAHRPDLPKRLANIGLTP